VHRESNHEHACLAAEQEIGMHANLIEAAQAGDRDALAALLKQHDAAVRQEVATNLPQRWRAELGVDDVLQVTYTDAFLAIAQCTAADDAGLVGWLKSIALNNLRDAIRRLEAEKRGGHARRVFAPGSTDATQTFLEGLLGADSQTPSRAMMRAEAGQALRDALAKLPEAYRLAVELYDLQTLPIDEVAAKLKRSPGAVHLLRVRAHARLREILVADASIFRDSA
jgi:RNA polymerase sigma-70 factor (ECF subfamily)